MMWIVFGLASLTAFGQESDPDDTAQAWYYYQLGALEQSRQASAALLSADTTNAAAHRVWATATLRWEPFNYETTAEMYRNWIADEPDNAALRVGLVSMLSASFDKEQKQANCSEAQEQVAHLDSEGTRSRYEGLRALQGMACEEVDADALNEELKALAAMDDADLTVRGYGVYLRSKDGFDEALVEDIEGLTAFPNFRLVQVVGVAFGDSVDPEDSNVLAVRTIAKEAFEQWRDSEDSRTVHIASELALTMGLEEDAEALKQRRDELEPIPEKESTNRYTDEMRLIADADRKPTHEAALKGLDKMARKVEKMEPSAQAMWHQYRAKRLKGLSRFDEANEATRQRVLLDPSNGSVVNEFAYDAALAGRDLELALELITRVLAERKPPKWVDGWTAQLWSQSYLSNTAAWEDTRGWLLYQLGRHQEAVDSLRVACSLGPDAVMSAHLGMALVAAGDEKEAFHWLAEAHRYSDQMEHEHDLRSSSRAELERLWPSTGKVFPGGLDGWLVATRPEVPVPGASGEGEDNPLSGGEAHPLIGEEWPIKTGTRLGGGTLEVAPPADGLLVVDIWATWCGPCVAGMPHLQEVANAYADRNVDVVGLSVDQQMAPVKKFFKGVSGLDYELAHIGGTGWQDLSLDGIPALFIVGSDGRVLRYISGYTSNDTRLEEALDYFLENGTVADAD